MTSRLFRLLPGVGFAAALALVLILARQNRALADRAVKLQRRATEPYIGLYEPTITVSTLSRAAVTIGERPDSARQLLLVFTTTCPYCRASLPTWQRLASIADTIRDHRTVTYGVVLDSGDAAQYAGEHKLAFPIVHFPGRKMQSIYRVQSVPLILLLDANGQAIYSRLGVLEPGNKLAFDSVVARLHFQRPATAVANHDPKTTPGS